MTRNLLAFPKRPAPPPQAGGGQPDRQVLDDPRDAWQLWFPRNLTVQQVVNILRASRMGDQWQLASLVEVMLDSWPMLKKCQHELRSAVSQTKFTVHAYSVGGKEPTARAQEKADVVRKAMASYRPNPAVTDERGFAGMVYDLTNAYLVGMSLVEQQWHQYEGLWLPRAATFCHPAHVVLDDSAQVNVATTRDGTTIPFNPNFFITSVFQSQSGSVFAMGMVRSIGWWWAALLAVQQWMFGSAQKYGSPYTFLTYARDLMGNKAELDAIETALNNSGANRYLMAPEGCTADLKPPGTMGSENPQRYMKEQADKEVMQLFLGQTSSTNAEPGRLGNNDQHMEVRAERKEAVAKWIGNILTEQWATAILRRNYGDDSECPTVEPDFTEVETRIQAAQRISTEINTGLPLDAKEVYNDLNRRVPEAGDLVIQRGQLGVMSDPAGTPIQPSLEEQVEQQMMIAEASGQFEEPVQARGRIIATEQGHPFYGNQWTKGNLLGKLSPQQKAKFVKSPTAVQSLHDLKSEVERHLLEKGYVKKRTDGAVHFWQHGDGTKELIQDIHPSSHLFDWMRENQAKDLLQSGARASAKGNLKQAITEEYKAGSGSRYLSVVHEGKPYRVRIADHTQRSEKPEVAESESMSKHNLRQLAPGHEDIEEVEIISHDPKSVTRDQIFEAVKKHTINASASQIGHPFHGNQWTKLALDRNNDPEGTPKGRIKHAALVINGKRYRGPSHFQAFMAAVREYGEAGKAHELPMPDTGAMLEGFETESGHFLDRDQAKHYAGVRTSGDISNQVIPLVAREGKLYTQEAVMAEESNGSKKKSWITLRS